MSIQDAISPIEPFVSDKARWVEANRYVSTCFGGGDVESLSLLSDSSTKRYLVRVGDEYFEFVHTGALSHHQRVEKVKHLAKTDLESYIQNCKTYEALLKAHGAT